MELTRTRPWKAKPAEQAQQPRWPGPTLNAIGDIVAVDGTLLAGERNDDGLSLRDTVASVLAGHGAVRVVPGSATTIGIVATDAALSKAGAHTLSGLAHHGLSRAVQPVSVNDSDTLFALATGTADVRADLNLIRTLAAEAVARAIRDAVLAAVGLPVFKLPAARDLPAFKGAGR